jgi:hypothetical protein
MPGAGDAGNVKPNLRTLASLVLRGNGAKLSYDTKTGRFSVQDPGFKQSVARTLTGESVLDETRFREPLLELFHAAAKMPVEDNEDLFSEARKGLTCLEKTYSGAQVYDLRLMSSVKDVSALPKAGKRLVIVAAVDLAPPLRIFDDVDRALHFRIFDTVGKMVVDTDETKPTAQAQRIENLRGELETLWPPHKLTTSEKDRVIDAVTSIVGYTRDEQRTSVVRRVIAEIDRWIMPENDDAIYLRQQYQRYLQYGISQRILKVGPRGVCFGFVCDWARRILASGKPTYAAKWTGGEYAEVAPSVRPCVEERARMMRKVDRRIQPFHEELKVVMGRVRGTQGDAFNRVVNPQEKKFYKERFYMFQDLRIEPYDHGGDQIIAQLHRGRTVLKRILAVARRHLREAEVFLVNLWKREMIGVDRGGHGIGIHLSQGGLHFFDPNVGEFWFPQGSESERDSFLDEWWERFCKESQYVQKYGHWVLEGVTKVKT